MAHHDLKSAERPAPDEILQAIADYALSYQVNSEAAYETAYYCLMDTLACGFQALQYPACHEVAGAGGAGCGDAGRLAKCRARATSSTRCRRRSISARWFAGSISMTRGWRRSGVILPTTSAAFWRSRTISPAGVGHREGGVAGEGCAHRDDQGATRSRASARWRIVSIGLDWIMCCWCASRRPR